MSAADVRREVAVIGSGFAGTILARALNRRGRQVVLIERDRHPRFALGESSTPLAALSLERLALCYDLDDLTALASYGAWLERFPEVRRGLKRGFTFYAHRRGEPFANGPDNESRLLVGASPDNRAADAHWLRADVDAHLVDRARAEGVELWEEAELAGASDGADGLHLVLRRGDRSLTLLADFVVDAAGVSSLFTPRSDLATALPPHPAAPPTALLYTHLRGVRDFASEASGGGHFGRGPYPDGAAAVHHLFDGGWMYVLRFDHGVTSAGLLLRDLDGADLLAAPADLWRRRLRRYPAIAAQFADSEPLFEPVFVPRIQRRTDSPIGRRWLSLPHAYAFHDPLYSTGVAWSLLAVERVADLLTRGTPPADDDLLRYSRRLHDEANLIEQLVEMAYLTLDDFTLFTAQSFVYFALASYSELRERLLPDANEWPWQGFLGAGDPVGDSIVERVHARLRELRGDGATVSAGARRSLAEAITDWIAPRNLIGLGEPGRDNLYPIDLDRLVERSSLLDMSRSELRRALPRLRGADAG